MEPEPPGAAFFAWSRSRPNLVGAVAGVGSGTSDFRSRSRPKQWQLRKYSQLRIRIRSQGCATRIWIRIIPFIDSKLTQKIRAVDPHSFYADPDPAVFLNADPDPDPGPGPA